MATVHHRIPHPLHPANHRRRQGHHPENVSTATASGESMARLGAALALRGQSPARISSIVAGRRFQSRSRPFCATSTRSPDPTVEKSRVEGEGAAGDVGKAEAVTLPPPPERPLPGDCCGSGCVRCVWDVYHEELQEYRDLLAKAKPEP